MRLDVLIDKQNVDGGWPYVRGCSWTEPTAYATIALLATGEADRASKGIRWLLLQQRPDGGWAAQPKVAESCWVTALVALLPPELLGEAVHRRAVGWLLRVAGAESTASYRFFSWVFRNRIPPEQAHPGWPFVPGTAAWVAPTAFAILALEKACRGGKSALARERVAAAREFLLSRTCETGGWNFGGVPDLEPPAHAYPEITGLVLCALRGVEAPKVQRALTVARALLDTCRSADGLNWLRLGLGAHGCFPADYRPPASILCRTVPDLALEALVKAAETGRSVFWE